MFLTLGILLASFVPIMVLHESGHVIGAKMAGFKVRDIKFFLGRAILTTSVRLGQDDALIYVGWLPLAARVRIVKPANKAQSLRASLYYIFGGPAVDGLLAWAALTVAMWLGAVDSMYRLGLVGVSSVSLPMAPIAAFCIVLLVWVSMQYFYVLLAWSAVALPASLLIGTKIVGIGLPEYVTGLWSRLDQGFMSWDANDLLITAEILVDSSIGQPELLVFLLGILLSIVLSMNLSLVPFSDGFFATLAVIEKLLNVDLVMRVPRIALAIFVAMYSSAIASGLLIWLGV